MWCLKIWLAVIVVFVTFTSINTSQRLDLKRHDNERVKYSCKHRNICKNGGTCIPHRRHGWFRRCICPDGWAGRRCNIKYGCKHSNMCKNGGTCIPYRRHGWFRKCICLDGWTGRRCSVPIPNSACKNKKFCRNGGTLVCSGKSRRSGKCICTDDWSGRRCDERAGNRIEYQDFVSYLEIDPEMQKHPQNIFMTTDTPTNVKITTSKTPDDQFTRFNSSITIRYPDFGTNVSSELKAIRIRSTENITVAVSAHHDITTLIPTEKLSTSYIVSPPSPDRRFQTVDAMTITALQDNTSIVLSESGFSVITNYTLDALETRIHRNADVLAYNIQSSKPVAVFCGMYCMSDVNCSNMIEQIPPSNQLDTIYIVPPNIDMLRTSATIITEKNTFITVRGITIPYGPGRRTRLSITDNVLVLRSVDPILVTSQAFHKDASVGSPYLTVVPGVNQYLPWYKVVVPSGWNTNYIAVMMRKSAVSGLRANKQPIKANTIRFEKNIAIEDLEYSVIIAEIAEGELTLDTIDNTPFGLMVYGNRAGAGYGFAGNVVLR